MNTALPLPPSRLLTTLWMLVGLTFPLFAVDELRLNFQSVLIHIAPPAMFLAIIAVLGLLAVIERAGTVPRSMFAVRHWNLFVAVVVLFFLWHLFESVRSNSVLGVREVVKLGTGVLCLFGTYLFFPRDPRVLDRFWQAVVWSSAVVMGYLVYIYAFVFGAEFVGIVLNEQNTAGRNKLGSYLAFVVPFALFNLLTARRKPVAAIPALILLGATAYSGVRGAWLSTIIGFCSIAVPAVRGRSLKKLGGAVIVAATLAFVAMYLLNFYIGDKVELAWQSRLAQLVKPEPLSGRSSFETRLEINLETWRVFLSSPIIGVGLFNTGARVSLISHNDYLSIASDLGAVGLLLFLSCLAIVWSNLRRLASREGFTRANWTSWGTKMSFVALLAFMFTIERFYTTMLFWIFMGMCLVAHDLAARRPRRPVVRPQPSHALVSRTAPAHP